MKIKVGDVALFKVEKDLVLGVIDKNCFRVLDMKIEPRVVDFFFERFYPFSLSKVVLCYVSFTINFYDYYIDV